MKTTNPVHVLIHPHKKVSFVCSYSPDKISGKIAAYFISSLISWIDSCNSGAVFQWDAAFTLSNGNIFILGNIELSRKQIKYGISFSKKVISDLVIQIKSSNDQLLSMQENIQHLLELGTQVAVIIDADNQTFTVYRPRGKVTALTDRDIFAMPEFLPGWQIPIAMIWSRNNMECL